MTTEDHSELTSSNSWRMCKQYLIQAKKSDIEKLQRRCIEDLIIMSNKHIAGELGSDEIGGGKVFSKLDQYDSSTLQRLQNDNS